MSFWKYAKESVRALQMEFGLKARPQKTPDDLGDELVLAIKVPPEHQDTDRIKKLIQSGASLERRDVHGINPHNFNVLEATPLIWAVMNDQTDLVEMLIDYGADVNAYDKTGWTPLMRAARRGHRVALDLLLSANADISAIDHVEMTAAKHATVEGHIDIATLLNDIQNGSQSRPTYFQDKKKEIMTGWADKGVQEAVKVKTFKGFKK